MPRQTRAKSKSQTKKPGVKAHTPEKKDDDKPDAKLVGYHFPGLAYKDKTPLDYKVNPNTGIREGEHGGAWSVGKHDVSNGIKDAVLPPLFIWNEGRWLTDFMEGQDPIHKCRFIGCTDKESEELAKNVWVVHGEGTPGDYVFRAYLVPFEVAQHQSPPHPMLWDPDYRTKSSLSFTAQTRWPWDTRPQKPFECYHASWDLLDLGFRENIDEYKPKTGQGSGVGYGFQSAKPAVVTTPKPVSGSSLPIGVRIRHLCGHWFKESDLPGHSKVCPAVTGDLDADWALLCDDKCGCEMIKGFPSENHVLGHKTLDHVSRCKPGYEPKPKPKEVPASADGTNGATSDAPAQASTPGQNTSSESSDSTTPQEVPV